MIPAFRQQDGRAALVDRPDDVIQDQIVSPLVGCQSAVDLLNPRLLRSPVQAEGCFADDQLMAERPPCRLTLRVHHEAHGPELHAQDRVVPIAAVGRRREAQDVAGAHLAEYTLERNRRNVVTLVDDDVSVAGHDILDTSLPDQALDHGDVQPAVGLSLASADPPDFLLPEAQEHRQLRDPLVEERPSVNHDQGASSSLGDEVRAQHGLADAWRCDEHADFVIEKGPCRLLLDGGQLALEMEERFVAVSTLIIDYERDAVMLE